MMPTLAHKLRLVDYFVLAFGVMVGTAWLVVMDNLLQRGGPMGALLGFTVGALMLLPIGYVYGELVKAIPDDAGEAAYVARLFSPAEYRRALPTRRTPGLPVAPTVWAVHHCLFDLSELSGNSG